MGRKEFDEQVGGNLKILRKIYGISQSEAGRCLGVSFQQVQKYETGRNSLRLYDSMRLARLLHSTLAELAESKPDPYRLTVRETFRILHVAFVEALHAVKISEPMSRAEVETRCRQIEAMSRQMDRLRKRILRQTV